jgi:hypothetical protein
MSRKQYLLKLLNRALYPERISTILNERDDLVFEYMRYSGGAGKNNGAKTMPANAQASGISDEDLILHITFVQMSLQVFLIAVPFLIFNLVWYAPLPFLCNQDAPCHVYFEVIIANSEALSTLRPCGHQAFALKIHPICHTPFEIYGGFHHGHFRYRHHYNLVYIPWFTLAKCVNVGFP